MKCDKIIYRNFRNIEYAEIVPDEEITVLYGKNGQGKTNALEGMYIFAGGRSFRTPREKELVRFGSESAQITLFCRDEKRKHELDIRWLLPQNKRFCKKNGVPLKKMSELIGTFRAVVFCPEHLAIVKEGPSMRRGFLDVALSQLEPVYLSSLQRYGSILAQRNALIKDCVYRGKSDVFASTAEIWSSQLAKEAEFIARRRAEYVEKLGCHVNEFLSDMTSGKEKAEFSYTAPQSESEYFKLLTENTERELKYGATLYGIHKDDIDIKLGGHEARSYASQGQQRSIALSMKLSEGEISKENTGEYPVFLFDDILSELDDGRKSYLLSGIAGRQVIITSCDKIPSDGKVYKVDGGKFV